MIDQRGETGAGLGRLFRLGTTAGITDAELLERFVAGEREDAILAFEAIVERHGPMVRRICQVRLRDSHSADDAFQATFLVLARKARTLRSHDLLGGWLYGVALRTAQKSRMLAVRRHNRERRIAGERRYLVAPDRDEQQPENRCEEALHEEIERLPVSYRAAVVACYLEGLTQAHAARQLCVSESTIRGRLARARKLLGQRLTRRGIIFPGFMDPGVLPFSVLSERLPYRLVCVTARTAFEFINCHEGMPVMISGTVQSIANRVILAMAVPSFGKCVTAVVAAGILVGGAGVARRDTVKARQQSPSKARHETSAVDRILEPPVRVANRTTQASNDSRQPESQGDPLSSQSLLVTPELAKIVSAPIVRAIPLSKDCMILAYLPDWARGNVDNIGVGNNGGGVRTLLEWPEIPRNEMDAPDLRFIMALYARQTISHPPIGRIHAFVIREDWPELTSWNTKPAYNPDPAKSFKFAPGTGWKLFDITDIVREDAKAERKGRGVILKFLNEDFAPRGREETFSDYKFVSREGSGEWINRRPVLLVTKFPSRGSTD